MCLRQMRSFEKTSLKLASFRNHQRFNLRCFLERVTPRSIKLTSNVTGLKADKILKNTERKLLNERVRQVNFKMKALKEKQEQLTKRLADCLKSECFNKVKEFTHGL